MNFFARFGGAKGLEKDFALLPDRGYYVLMRLLVLLSFLLSGLFIPEPQGAWSASVDRAFDKAATLYSLSLYQFNRVVREQKSTDSFDFGTIFDVRETLNSASQLSIQKAASRPLQTALYILFCSLLR